MVTQQRVEKMQRVASRRTNAITLVLDGIHDPHNIAAILRSADAFGIQTIHAIEGSSGIRISDKVARGARKWVDLYRYNNPEVVFTGLERFGYNFWVAAAKPGSILLHEWQPVFPIAVVLGNEHAGVSPFWLAHAHGFFQIEMLGMVESLNVSVASAVGLYTLQQHLQKQKQAQQIQIEKNVLFERWLQQEHRNGASPS